MRQREEDAAVAAAAGTRQNVDDAHRSGRTTCLHPVQDNCCKTGCRKYFIVIAAAARTPSSFPPPSSNLTVFRLQLLCLTQREIEGGEGQKENSTVIHRTRGGDRRGECGQRGTRLSIARKRQTILIKAVLMMRINSEMCVMETKSQM